MWVVELVQLPYSMLILLFPIDLLTQGPSSDRRPFGASSLMGLIISLQVETVVCQNQDFCMLKI